jgi:hypothetical protein
MSHGFADTSSEVRETFQNFNMFFAGDRLPATLPRVA